MGYHFCRVVSDTPYNGYFTTISFQSQNFTQNYSNFFHSSETCIVDALSAKHSSAFFISTLLSHSEQQDETTKTVTLDFTGLLLIPCDLTAAIITTTGVYKTLTITNETR